MVLPAERSLNPSPQACSWQRMLVALYGGAVLLVVVIGVLGLLNAPWPRQILESWINIHALFGMLLCGLVLARCQWHIKYSPPLLASDIRDLSRHLSRTVYVLLYVVIGVRLSLCILGNIWHGGVVDFSMIGRFRNGPDSLAFDPNDDFQGFLGSGLTALVSVRVLAFGMWLRAGARQRHRWNQVP